MDHYKLVYFRRVDGKWDWRVVSSNRNIVGTSGNQGYENFADARDMAQRILDSEISHEFEIDTTAFDERMEPA